jgi:hypothetical protein
MAPSTAASRRQPSPASEPGRIHSVLHSVLPSCRAAVLPWCCAAVPSCCCGVVVPWCRGAVRQWICCGTYPFGNVRNPFSISKLLLEHQRGVLNHATISVTRRNGRLGRGTRQAACGLAASGAVGQCRPPRRHLSLLSRLRLRLRVAAGSGKWRG